MATTGMLLLCCIILALWLGRCIRCHDNGNRRVTPSHSEDESGLSASVTNSAHMPGSQQRDSISDASAPATSETSDELETKPATVSHHPKTPSAKIELPTSPHVTPAVQAESSSPAAFWDEDDLDFIETRAAEHREWRTAAASQAAFDDDTDYFDRGEKRSSRPVFDAQAETPRQTDLFEGKSSDQRRPSSDGPKSRESSGNSCTSGKDVTDRPNVAPTPTGPLFSDDTALPDTGALDPPTRSSNTAEWPRAAPATEVPAPALPDATTSISSAAYTADDYAESFTDDDDLLALDESDAEPDDDTDLLDALPDAQLLAETDDEPEAPLYEVDSDGDRLGDYGKARRLAAQTIRHVDGDADALWPVLLDIFQASPWPATQRSIERLLHSGTNIQALALAAEIRRIWIDHSEFGQAARIAYGRGERWQYTADAHAQLSWPRAAKLADCWPSYPDLAEIEHFLENLFDRWHTSGVAIRAFPSFHLYLGYATGDLNGTLEDWPELNFEMNEALEDPFERLESSDEWSSTRAVLADFGVDRPMTHKPFGPEIEMPE